jgi:hypothetical protein
MASGSREGRVRADTSRVNPRTRNRVIEILLVIAGFTLLGVLITWPAAANANTLIPTDGGLAWDPAGFTWDLWQRLRDGLPLFGNGSTDLVAPFTVEYPAAFNLLQLSFYGPAVLIAGVATPAFAMNVMIIAGIALSGMAMYWLARWIGAGPGLASWSGLALAVSPYVLGKAVVHAPLVSVACFPLIILSGLWWAERPSWRRALAVTGAFALAWTTSGYYGLIATVMVVVICGWALIGAARSRGWRAGLAPGGVLAAMLGLLVLLPIGISVASSSAPSPARSRDELGTFGARFGDLFTPAPDQVVSNGISPGWFDITGITGERLIVYLGIPTVLMAIAAGALAWWRPGWLPGARAVRATRVGTVLAPLLMWFSLAWPMAIGPIPIPVPSILIWQVAPEFRVFSRFAVAALVVLIMMAAMLLVAIVRRGGQIWRYSIIAAALLITGADTLTAVPLTVSPPATANGQAPAEREAWAWLRDQEAPGAVVEYPTTLPVFVPGLESIYRVYAMGQTIHGRPVLDIPRPMGLPIDPRTLDLARDVGGVTGPGTPERLARAGVRYAVINPWAYRTLGISEGPDVRNPPPGFRVARVFDDGTAIWEVTASPTP